MVALLADGTLFVQASGTADGNKLLTCGMLSMAATLVATPPAPEPAPPKVELVRSTQMPDGGW